MRRMMITVIFIARIHVVYLFLFLFLFCTRSFLFNFEKKKKNMYSTQYMFYTFLKRCCFQTKRRSSIQIKTDAFKRFSNKEQTMHIWFVFFSFSINIHNIKALMIKDFLFHVLCTTTVHCTHKTHILTLPVIFLSTNIFFNRRKNASDCDDDKNS